MTDRPEGYPPTPSLDRIIAVRDRSEEIGDFVVRHLGDQGIVPARWVWVRYPCWKSWTRSNGELVEAGILVPDDQLEVIDPFECPCEPSDREAPGPHMKRELWPIPLTDSWMNEELARFYGLDPAEIERERAAVLEYVRARNERTG